VDIRTLRGSIWSWGCTGCGMRQILTICLLTALAFVLPANAQYGPESGPYQYQPSSVNALVDKVHSDLSQGYEHWRLASADRNRLNNAEKKLRSFARDWEHAKFDKGELDEFIAAVQHVLDNNHLAGVERDALWNDVESLRHMREAYDRHEIGRW
jgi:hypothetical protein